MPSSMPKVHSRKKNKLKLFNCSGTFYDMGKRQGQWSKPYVLPIFKALTETPFTPFLLRQYGTAKIMKLIFSVLGYKHFFGLLKEIKNGVPRQYERLCGLAKTSSVSLAGLLALNDIEMTAAEFHFVGGCCTLAFHPRRLKDSNKPLLTYNHDFPPFMGPFIVLRRSKPIGGFHSLQLAYPVLVGCIAGVNDQGLAVSLNHAFPVEDSKPGVPITMLVQEVLDSCATVFQAVHFLEQTNPACGSMISLLDKKGKMATVELARTRKSVRKDKNGILMTINQYETKALKEIEIPKNAYFDPKKFPPIFHGLLIHTNNLSRSKRLRQLIKPNKRYTKQEIFSIMKDHDGGNTLGIKGICRHHDTSDTLVSARIFPTDGVMQVIPGNPCMGSYQTYRL